MSSVTERYAAYWQKFRDEQRAEGGEVPWHDPTHGRIDRDIQEAVTEMGCKNVAQAAAIENTLQTRRDEGRKINGYWRVHCPACNHSWLDPDPSRCPACHSAGLTFGKPKCDTCHGAETILLTEAQHGGVPEHRGPCPDCQGTAAVGRELLHEGTVDGVPTAITAPRGGVQYPRPLPDAPAYGSLQEQITRVLTVEAYREVDPGLLADSIIEVVQRHTPRPPEPIHRHVDIPTMTVSALREHLEPVPGDLEVLVHAEDDGGSTGVTVFAALKAVSWEPTCAGPEVLRLFADTTEDDPT